MPSEKSQPLNNGDVDILDSSMEELEAMSMDERCEFYQKFAALVLLRHLISKNLVEEGVSKEDIKMLKDCDVETASGISFIYDIRGSRWTVFLEREDACKAAIEENPSRLTDDPDCYKMDLRKSAKVINQNAKFYN